jgi:hypothetical protein
MILNNWWQMLQITLDSISTDQEDLVHLINEDILMYFNNVQDEINIIEKRLLGEGQRAFTTIRENLLQFDVKLKERDKNKEKLRNTPIQASPSSTVMNDRNSSSVGARGGHVSNNNDGINGPSESYQRRAQRLKNSDDLLVAQTKRLFEVQREFYSLLPRITSDIQLTILKSIVETQSQLLKLSDGMERISQSNRWICTRMKTQLSNAATSLIQNIREDTNLMILGPSTMATSGGTPPSANTGVMPGGDGCVPVLSIEGSGAGGGGGGVYDSPSIALQIMRSRMYASGIKGFELTLQKVLEGLLIQSQLHTNREGEATSPSAIGGTSGGGGPVQIPMGAYIAEAKKNGIDTGSGKGRSEDLTNLTVLEDLGKLNMFSEATATLAASNPTILPELPPSFAFAIGTETGIWFNALLGRIYRDIATSEYFYHWFCTKVMSFFSCGVFSLSVLPACANA